MRKGYLSQGRQAKAQANHSLARALAIRKHVVETLRKVRTKKAAAHAHLNDDIILLASNS